MLDREHVKQVMAAVLDIEAAAIGDDTSMDNVPSWDSLCQMNLVLALEQAFGVSIPDDDAANATSFKLVLLVLEEQLATA
ncbi:MAG: acyl carrier protein [Rubrivivax sp.]